MAGLWIAWVKGLTRRREVVVMAAALNLDRRTVAALWMELWEWLDEEGGIWFDEGDGDRGLLVQGVTVGFIDALLETPLFSCDACATGWMEVRDGGLYFRHFGRWNGSSAKERLANARRQQKHRNKRNASTVTKARPEKRREEYNPPTPPGGEYAVGLKPKGNTRLVACYQDATRPILDAGSALSRKGREGKGSNTPSPPPGDGERAEDIGNDTAIRSALCSIWKIVDNQDTDRRLTRLTGVYRRLGATPEAIEGCRKRVAGEYSSPSKATPEAVARHWGEFRTDGPYRPKAKP